ncbi:MAG: class I SAM-dependent methyltransferase [Candidatus Scalinduaceae bacterium]
MITEEVITSKPNTCPVCSSQDVYIFIEMLQVPVHCNVLWLTREEALRAPRADLRLGFCKVCGHVYNFAFNPDDMEYTQDYENSLHFSPRFQEYVKSLATRLIDQHDLHNKDIIEIGCGKGEFLTMLCEFGGNRGVGFDSSYEDERTGNKSTKNINFIRDFYSERYAGYKADAICCRHVLEHIKSPFDFLTDLRNVIGDRLDTKIFFEVPNFMFTLNDLGIWDLIYEHCSYFSVCSLAQVFHSCRFKVVNLTEAFEGQFLWIEALPVGDLAYSKREYRDYYKKMAYDVTVFAERYRDKVDAWHSEIKKIVNKGDRAVIWGSGSKGITFLNKINTQGQIEYVVDINPHKHGKYVSGTGQKIVPPEFLRKYQPDIIIVMNPIYLDEIRQITESMNITAKFVKT